METRQTYVMRTELEKQSRHWRRIAARAESAEELETAMRREISACAGCMPEGPCRTLLEDALDWVNWRKLSREWFTSTVEEGS